ncbi:MAG: large subunit ribosomal protein L31e [Natronomonas sp.]|jgi:large subunit ribosomal protein L31e
MSAGDFEERVVTVPLRDARVEAGHEQANAAMGIIRDHLAQHFSVDEAAVRLDPSINSAVWAESTPPRKLRVRAARFDEEGESVVEAETAE